jgi:hypothetical protein
MSDVTDIIFHADAIYGNRAEYAPAILDLAPVPVPEAGVGGKQRGGQD